jgi:hypothetical protein
MSKNAIDHVILTDDDGSGTTGTIINNALFDQVQDEVDEAIQQVTQTKNGNYTVVSTDDCVICTAALTLTLYAASGNSGRSLDVANDSTGVVVLDGNSSETIDGATTYKIPSGGRVRIRCDGSNWKSVTPRTAVMDRDVSSTTVGPSSTTETTVYSGTIPGGLLSTNRVLEIKHVGDYLNSSGGASTLTINVYLGATLALSFALAGLTSNGTRRFLRLEAEIGANNSASAQVAWGVARTHPLGDTTNATGQNMIGSPGVIYEHAQVDLAENSANDLALEIKYQHSVSSGSVSATAYRTLVKVT